MTDRDFNELFEKIKEFLKPFHYPGERRPFMMRNNADTWKRSFIGDIDKVRARLGTKLEETHAYYGVCNSTGETRQEKDMGHTRYIFVDMDHMAVEEALKRVKESGLPKPTIIINSGHGAQLLWRLDKWYFLQKEDNVALFKRVLKSIASMLGGDQNATLVTQVLRMPYTFNPKDPPAEAILIEQNDTEHPIAAFDPGTGIDAIKWVFKNKPRHNEDTNVPGLRQLTWATIAGFAYHNNVPLQEALDALIEICGIRDGIKTEELIRCVEGTYNQGESGTEISYNEFKGKRYERIVQDGLKVLWSMKAKLQGAIKIGSDRYVTSDDNGGRIIFTGEKNVTWEQVTLIPAIPEASWIIDGEAYWKLKGVGEGMMNRVGIREYFEENHKITGHRFFGDWLSGVMTTAPDPIIGHATVGFYRDEDDKDRLVFCKTPYPVYDLQIKTHAMVKPYLNVIPTKEELQAYVDFLRHWEDYEILPVVGLAFIATLSFVLRADNRMIPHGLLKGLRDLGKSLVALAFSWKMFKIEPLDNDVLRTPWRLFQLFDSICGMRAFNEVEIGERIVSALKTGAEQLTLTGSGYPGHAKKIDMSHARGAFQFSTNGEGVSDNLPLAKRFFEARYNPTEKEKLPMKERMKIQREYDRLQTIGWGLVQMLGDLSFKELVASIENWEEQIITMGNKMSTPSRAEIWAILYQGLQMFITLCKMLDVDFDYSIENWVQKVIIPIEKGMLEGERSPFNNYLDARLQWRTKNSVIQSSWTQDDDGKNKERHNVTVVKSEGESWKEGVVNLNEEMIEGEWHSTGIIGQIMALLPDGCQKQSAADLGREVLRHLGLEERALPTVYKQQRYGTSNPVQSVFIPL